MPDVNLTVFAPETASRAPPLTVTSVSEASFSSAGFTSSSVPFTAFLLIKISDSGLGVSSILSFMITKLVFESTVLSSGPGTVDDESSATPFTILNLTSAVT